jgi:hypothetical protein
VDQPGVGQSGEVVMEVVENAMGRGSTIDDGGWRFSILDLLSSILDF